MLQLLSGGPYQPLDNNGNIVVGGKLTFYIAGTVTKSNTYTDSAGLVPNSNPVILDGNGRASIYLGIANAYDILFTDANNVTIWSQPNVVSPTSAI